ncbi:glycosyltransferase [Hydrogenophaga sp. NFH-34]|uniref:glycosyltransferase n=1 Tax=Hydrogenophaga sp. NFH-34 TaxID=2744446 RepID=UPI001F42C4F9|nr:glycosyltransferase [Hydrogenophaga sp. NFH-34]
MIEEPDISIISISHKNLQGLRETFCSLTPILNRDDLRIEWFVVDAESNTQTLEFLKETSATLKNFNFIFEKDQGIYDAMNKGVRAARGKYIWFLNAGDLATNNIDANTFIEPIKDAPDAIFFDVYYDYGKKKYLRKAKPIEYARYGMPANHQGIIYNRKFLKKTHIL